MESLLKFRQEDGFTFFGPNHDLQENVRTKGYRIFPVTIDGKRSPVNDTACWIVLPESVSIRSADVFFYLNCYARNVSAYKVMLEDSRHQRYEKEFTVTTNGYQLPRETILSAWMNEKGSSIPDSFAVKYLAISAQKNNNGESPEMVIGGMKLVKRSWKVMPAKGCFFYQLTADPANHSPDYTVKDIGNCYPLERFTIFRDTYAQSFVLSQQQALQPKQMEDSVIRLLQFIIGKYPYYQEHKLDKKQVMAAVNNIVNSPDNFRKKIDKLDSIVNTFSDGHFYLEKPTGPPLLAGPVMVRELSGQLEVVAVFDTVLQSRLKPGDRLLRVDGIPADEYLQFVKARYYGNPEEKRNIAVAKMLYKTAADSSTITVADERGIEKQVTYYYNRKLSVSGNFKPVHGKGFMKNNIYYYRLNYWSGGDWINFYNHRDAVQSASAIIFDLRGNSGGAEVEAFRILSCFIREPAHIYSSEYHFNDTTKLSADNIVQPNRFLSLAGKKVVLLVDNNTACASEIFVQALRHYAGATVIGSERTSGAYASVEELYLPFDIVMHVNVLNKLVPDQRMPGNIEWDGITPDILVNLKNYNDLFPYEDKVLQTAYRYLEGGAALNSPR
ncbi:hypothetical protein HF329_13095 [Chitinophaga oryzae]|uniref:Tail specific protease domain-containing protein n=1 Tax=Chitinophaga oryzae TaxID=2725414 RepID=A0AAE6ZFS0_9BACT|nr:S41 family peptidase [Chitinophaga oryzae]QJB32210.1 hypothetical protein HF329_13095 [Chitinophaga oryzae]